MKKVKYTASFAKVNTKAKATTYGFEPYEFKSLRDYGEACMTNASIPVTVTGGHRVYDGVTKIHNWLRFDCDEEGEKATICSVLESHGLAYVATPSTNYDRKLKSYKWHIQVPTTRTAQDVEQYKKQCKVALSDLGITLHDMRVTHVCVQNMNPYKNGTDVKKGLKYMEVHEGQPYKLSKPDKKVKYSVMSKTIYNGKGSDEPINVAISSVQGNMTKLSPSSGIRVEQVGWTTLGALNLEVGQSISQLCCPVHNTRHNNGKGGHQTGYAFASMNEGGDVWITCTGAECNGKSFMMEQEDYGAFTKLTDLYELRRMVSLSGFDFKSSTVTYINSDDVLTSFRDKEIMNHWGKEMFWKINTEPNDELQAKIDKLLRRAIKSLGKAGASRDEDGARTVLMQGDDAHRVEELLGQYGTYVKVLNVITAESSIQFEVEKLKSEHAWSVIEGALNNKYQYDKFRTEYEHHPDSYMGYVDDVVKRILTHIKTHRQYSEIEYEVKPYQTRTTGSIIKGAFVITLCNLSGDELQGKINEKIVADYKKHNPYLDDIIDMIMCQRFGADKKSSYLWMRAESNWGKTFLFDGIFGSLGYSVSSDEIKDALKGKPSGLSVTGLVASSFLFVDEFKGAVSELKNISHSIQVTQKNKGKVTVPMNMKIFASAEQIASLQNSEGEMDAQFSNRFLKIDVEGNLLKRKLFKNDKTAYFKAIKLYVSRRMNEIAESYKFYGEADGVRKADKRYSKLQAKYTMRNDAVNIEDTLADKFNAWLNELARREGVTAGKSLTHHECLDGMVVFHKDGERVFLSNTPKLKDVFVDEYIAKESRSSVNHKMPQMIMGYGKRTEMTINSDRRNGYFINRV